MLIIYVFNKIEQKALIWIVHEHHTCRQEGLLQVNASSSLKLMHDYGDWLCLANKLSTRLSV